MNLECRHFSTSRLDSNAWHGAKLSYHTVHDLGSARRMRWSEFFFFSSRLPTPGRLRRGGGCGGGGDHSHSFICFFGWEKPWMHVWRRGILGFGCWRWWMVFLPLCFTFFSFLLFCSRTEEGAALDALDRNHTCACMNLALRLILAHHWIDVSPQHLRQPRCRRWAAESCLSSCPENLAQCSSTVWHNIQ